MKPLFLILSLLTALILPSVAQNFTDDPFGAAAQDSNKITQASVLTDHSAIAPGKPFIISLKLTHQEGWHSYFHNDGLGISKVPTIEWTLPDGFTAGDLQWPTPHAYEFFNLTTYGYKGTNYFSTTITPPAELKPGKEVTIGLKAVWQTCKESCVDESFEQTLKLPVADTAAPNAEVSTTLATYNAANLPAQQPGNWNVSTTRDATQIVLRIETGSPLPANLFFYDFDGQADPQAKQTFTEPESGVWQVSIPLNKGNLINDQGGPTLDTLKGILSAQETLPGQEASAVWLETSFEESSSTAGSQTAPPFGKLLAILGGMFLGGLILNLMPCVFPVIGLKIMSFVEQAGEDRRKVTIHGIVFVLGVLVSFWVLAGLLLAGGIKNWGAQLENPWVVLTLLLVMLVLAMSMYGVFEIGTSATGIGGKLTSSGGMSGTFFSGVLATVVATPCAGPFLGTAIGATLGLPPFLFMLAFTTMGLGLGLPYLILSIFPSLVQRLPRPGAWMESFKQGMSFLLFASAGYLLWVYSGQVFEQLDGRKGFNVMLGISAFAAGLWIYGRWSVPARPTRTRWIARVLTILFLGGGFMAAMPSNTKNEWQPWTLELQEKLKEEGTPVYVDFTARWCVTCQTNKATAYTDEVKELIKKGEVVLLKADKTNTRDDIDEELRKLGGSPIPVNVLYVPGDPAPHITQTILTPSYLENFLRTKLQLEDASEDQ